MDDVVTVNAPTDSPKQAAPAAAPRDTATILRNTRRTLNRLVPLASGIAQRMGVTVPVNGTRLASSDIPGIARDCEVMVAELVEMLAGVDECLGPID